MATAWVIEPIYVFEDRDLGLDRLEERFDSCVVVTITPATHRYLEPMLAKDLQVIMWAILAASISVMDVALRR